MKHFILFISVLFLNFTYSWADTTLVSNHTVKRDELKKLPNLTFSPDLVYGYNGSNQTNSYRTGLGIHYTYSSDKHIFRGNYRLGYGDFFYQPYEITIAPKEFIPLKNNGGYFYNDLRINYTYKPNTLINLVAGIDNLHIGEGDRSFFLDQHATTSPFAGFKFKYSIFEYQFINQLLSESLYYNAKPFTNLKHSISHYLEIKPFKGFKFGIFENVIYGFKDQYYNRGLELEYLNPLIFFRPQEYALGSTDNVLLGINTSYSFGKLILANYQNPFKNCIYGQIALDEFNLADIKNKTKWWANKYAVQLGFKKIFNTHSEQNIFNYIFTRIEFNMARPYTYSHLNPYVVYGNQRNPLTHPLGSNFTEIYGEAIIRNVDKNYKIGIWSNYYMKGLDNPADPNVSFGGEIYQNYTNYLNEFGNTIGQGLKLNRFQIGMNLTKEIEFKNFYCQVFIEPILRIDRFQGETKSSICFQAGLTRQLNNDRRNY